MKDFNKSLLEVKNLLKGLISKDSTPEFIDKLTNADKALDDLNDAHKEKVEENASLKDKLIDRVYNTSFKAPASEEQEEKEVDLDEFINSNINEIIKSRK